MYASRREQSQFRLILNWFWNLCMLDCKASMKWCGNIALHNIRKRSMVPLRTSDDATMAPQWSHCDTRPCHYNPCSTNVSLPRYLTVPLRPSIERQLPATVPLQPLDPVTATPNLTTPTLITRTRYDTPLWRSLYRLSFPKIFNCTAWNIRDILCKTRQAHMTHMCQIVYFKVKVTVKVTWWLNTVKVSFTSYLITVLHEPINSHFKLTWWPWPLVKVTIWHLILKIIS